jgi:SAM-dependent MidA family methyltransferase
VTELLALVRERIDAAGRITFAEYQDLALYHPQHGYYGGGLRRTGRGGHFMTSAELAPLFGRLWARGFESIWSECGRPPRFEVVEIGPGEGDLAHAVLATCRGRFADALHYRLIERSSVVLERQRERLSGFDNVSWAASLAELNSPVGCAFANEVLDNLPVHLVERRGGRVVELFVATRQDRLVLEPGTPSDPALEHYLDDLELELPEGHRVEVCLGAIQLARDSATALERGAVVLVDYGMDAASMVQRPAGTLLAYSDTGVDDNPLERPGKKDLTSHVNWTAVAAALARSGMTVARPRPQSDVLASLGAAELDRALREELRTALVRGRGVEAVRALSFRQALGMLRDPGGLGGLQVLVGVRGIPVPETFAQ